MSEFKYTTTSATANPRLIVAATAAAAHNRVDSESVNNLNGGEGGVGQFAEYSVDSFGASFKVPVRLMQYLYANALYETELFRICTAPEECVALARAIEKGQGLNVELSVYATSTVAFTLKKILREASLPLIPFTLYPTLCNICSDRKQSASARALSMSAVIRSVGRPCVWCCGCGGSTCFLISCLLCAVK